MEFTLHFAEGIPSATYSRLPAPPVLTQASIANSPSKLTPLPRAHYVVTFVIPSGDLSSSNAILYADIPDIGLPFQRGKFREIPFEAFLAENVNLSINPNSTAISATNSNSLAKYTALSDLRCSVPISSSGIFEFFIEYDAFHIPQPYTDYKTCSHQAFPTPHQTMLKAPLDEKSVCDKCHSRRRSPSGYILVEPNIFTPAPSCCLSPLDVDTSPTTIRRIPLDGIVVQTIIPKWLPTLDQWDGFLSALQNQHYNYIHFAPLNVRGSSNSPYSLYEQLDFSHDLFKDPNLTSDERIKQLHNTLEKARDVYGLYSVTDIVWNHTASNSDWLLEHPDSGYNLVTSPHLNAAYDLDTAMVEFSGSLKSYGLDSNIGPNEEYKLNDILNKFKDEVYPNIKLWEYYTVNIDENVEKLEKFLLKDLKLPVGTDPKSIKLSESKLFGVCPQHLKHLCERFGSLPLQRMPLSGKAVVLKSAGLENSNILSLKYARHMNTEIAALFFVEFKSGETLIGEVLEEYKKILDIVNVDFYNEYNADTATIFMGLYNRAKYIRVDPSGPKLGPVTANSPLVGSYFVRLPKNEKTSKFEPGQLALAVNGWIWNADPLVNFANPKSKAYLLREVIEWGDCVKLRFGDQPKDNPWLWKRYEDYTRLMAKIFDGIRIDNCHSTPINVAAYLLDCAREENPDIYIFAELFTGSEEKDYIFCERLGIHSLVREAMNANSSGEIAHDLRKFGSGLPIGTFIVTPEYVPPFIVQGHFNQLVLNGNCTCSNVLIDCNSSNSSNRGNCGSLLSLEHRGSKLHALYVDCTHDNKMPNEIHTAEHTLPTAAIVSFSISAIGSTLGFDQLFPQHLDLVNLNGEKNKYHVDQLNVGIAKAKGRLNKLHLIMARESMCTSNIWEQNGVVFVQRMNPYNGKGYILAAFTKFNQSSPEYIHELSTIGLNGQRVKHYLSAKIKVTGGRGVIDTDKEKGFYFNPIESELEYFDENEDSPYFNVRMDNEGTNLAVTVLEPRLDKFTAGTIVVFQTIPIYDINSAEVHKEKSIDYVHKVVDLIPLTPKSEDEPRNVSCLGPLGDVKMLRYMSVLTHPPVIYDWGEYLHNPHLKDRILTPLTKIVSSFDLNDINITLFKCSSEESSVFPDLGAYAVPDYGSLAYCGLQGFYSYLKHIVKYNNPIGDKFVDALQYQNWIHDYIVHRLDRYIELYPDKTALIVFRDWLQATMNGVKQIAFPILRQHLFILIILHSYFVIRDRALEILLISDEESRLYNKCRVNNFKKVLLKSTRTCTLSKFVKNLQLTTFQLTSSDVADLVPLKDFPTELLSKGSMAAGLTHFSHGYMRCWGRDVMISIRGLYLINSQFKYSSTHLIAFASTLRHGLIPNLLDSGNKPRFNCRDAAWWFLYMVAEHCRASLEGLEYLNTVVPRRFVPRLRYRGKPNGIPPTNDEFLSHGINEVDNLPYVDTYCPLKSESSDSPAFMYSNTLAQICFEIIERHFLGIKFREYNAGPNIDHAMKDEGFNINVGVNPTTGFVYGGNQFNCGTWMDKMGDSQKAGNRGIPATPRDGSAVEIVGLSKNVLKFFSKEVQSTEEGKNIFPWIGVAAKSEILDKARLERKVGPADYYKPTESDIKQVIKSGDDKTEGFNTLYSFNEWEDAIQSNFHAWFYIPYEGEEDHEVNTVQSLNPSLINRRGIYKDTVGSTAGFTDYQLRCNVPIAMCVAPEIFKHKAGESALELTRDNLAGPIGIKTLDPSDWKYRGDYDNANDSEDPTVAHGFNYHQGPEWVYPFGFFLRAYTNFFSTTEEGKLADAKVVTNVHSYISSVLLTHKNLIEENPFAGLPELTNSDGKKCYDSCETQAWSNSIMIELIYDMFKQVSTLKNQVIG